MHLPLTIGQCARLRELFLNDTRLIRLPESIGQLARLEEFYLHRNELTQLPKSIRQLAQLHRGLSISVASGLVRHKLWQARTASELSLLDRFRHITNLVLA